MDKQATVRAALLPGVAFDVRGRSITYIVVRLVEFWGRHRITLAPYLDAATTAALDALAAAVGAVLAINPPGPD